jgi:hypothetical protein
VTWHDVGRNMRSTPGDASRKLKRSDRDYELPGKAYVIAKQRQARLARRPLVQPALAADN